MSTENQCKATLTRPDWATTSRVDGERVWHDRVVTLADEADEPFRIVLGTSDALRVVDGRAAIVRDDAPTVQVDNSILSLDVAAELAATVAEMVGLARGESARRTAEARQALDRLRSNEQAMRVEAWMSALSCRLAAIPAVELAEFPAVERPSHRWSASSESDEISRLHIRTFRHDDLSVAEVEVVATLAEDGSIVYGPPTLTLVEDVEVTADEAAGVARAVAEAVEFLTGLPTPPPAGPDERRAAAVAELRALVSLDAFLVASDASAVTR